MESARVRLYGPMDQILSPVRIVGGVVEDSARSILDQIGRMPVELITSTPMAIARFRRFPQRPLTWPSTSRASGVALVGQVRPRLSGRPVFPWSMRA